MTRLTRRETLFLLVTVAAVALAAAAPLKRLVWTRMIAPPETSAAQRGERLAAGLGCFGCHGPGGSGGVANPGAEEGDIPAFDGGVPMMYADDQTELRNWILWGDPKGEPAKQAGAAEPAIRLQHGMHSTTAGGPDGDHDEDSGEEHEHLIDMPAFRSRVTDAQLDDLVAFVDALSPPTPPEDPAARRGYDLAVKNGCFGCHGPMGSGGRPDPGSFKGYVPGWFGGDLSELATDDTEIAEWIRTGSSKRIESRMGAKSFLEGEVVKMPAYTDEYVSDAELADLVALVNVVHRQGPKPVSH